MVLKKTLACVALLLFVGTAGCSSGGGEATIDKPNQSDKQMMDEVMKEMAKGYEGMQGGDVAGKGRRGP